MPRPEKKSSRPKISEADLDAEELALQRAVRDPSLISGVYNYCDRWCERCTLTSRCLLFKMEESRAHRRGPAQSRRSRDLHQAAFWDDLATSFELAMRVIRREAKKHGIDLDSPGALAGMENDERERRRRAAREGNVLHRAATAYWKAAKTLLEKLRPELAATERALNTQVRLGTGEPHAVAAEIHDALEVVHWYLWMIDVKLQRAIASRVDRAAEPADNRPSDADGSAKVALIAIDRSIGAWARLRPHLSGAADAILDLLVQLERLRRAAEREFPHARAFKRPGFD